MSGSMENRQNARGTAEESTSLSLKTVDTESVECSGMHSLQKFGVSHAQEALATAFRAGMIAEEHIKGDVVDFGCGCGGSTWVLAKNGARVTAVDLSQRSLDELRALGAVNETAIRCEDGIAYLNGLTENSLDMVTAFMLGPDIEGQFVRDFYKAANHALKANGRLIVTSDLGTCQTLQKIVPQGFGFFKGHVFMGLKSSGTASAVGTFDHEYFGSDFGRERKFDLFGNTKFTLSDEQQALFADIVAKFKIDLDKKS